MNKITFFLPGYVVPKARPRVTRNGTFMPIRYRNWRNSAESILLTQVKQRGIESLLPVERATIEIQLTGKHRMSGDADNILGSFLDALVTVNVLKNDNLSCIPEVSLKFNPDGELGAFITITPLPLVAVKARKKKAVAVV